jgi:hypothetical protein
VCWSYVTVLNYKANKNLVQNTAFLAFCAKVALYRYVETASSLQAPRTLCPSLEPQKQWSLTFSSHSLNLGRSPRSPPPNTFSLPQDSTYQDTKKISWMYVILSWCWKKKEIFVCMRVCRDVYEGVSKHFRTESITKYTLTTINTCWEATQRVMAAKFTILTHKIAIQLHLVAESCTICSSRSRWPVRKLLDHTPICFVWM